MTRAGPVSSGLAGAMLIGGGYVAVLMGLGVFVFASESYPLAFGIDHWGDRGYPFPDGGPQLALLGLAVIAVGVTFGHILVRAAQRELWARRAAVGGFLVAASIAAAVAIGTSHERRCAVAEYNGIDHCMSRSAAAARDFVPIGLPAVVAIALLVREPSD